MENEVEDVELRNWVKACLALKYFKEGILPFISKKCDEFYIHKISVVEAECSSPYRCTSCDITKLEPHHAAKKIICSDKRCNCKRSGQISCKDHGSCGVLYDLLKNEHARCEPNWSNTKCDSWSDKQVGPWELIKCFIFTTGYREKTSIAHSDVTALIQICANNTKLRNAFRTDFVHLDKIRQVRNDIFHSGEMKLCEKDLQGFIDDMKRALQLSIFAKTQSAKEQLKKLTKLEKDKIRITTKNEIEAREDTLKALEDSKMELDILFSQGESTEQQIKHLTMVQNMHAKTLEKRYSELVEHIQRLYMEINETTKHVLEHKDILKEFKIDLDVELNRIRKLQENHGILLTENSKGILELLRRTEEISINQKDNKDATELVLRAVLNVQQTTEDVSRLITDVANGNRKDHPQLEDLLKNLVRYLENGGRKVTSVKNECVAIYMTFPTISNWIQFVKDCLNGSLVELFLPLETYLSTLPKCANLKLTFGITEHDFLAYADHLVKRVKYTMSSDISKDDDNVSVIELEHNGCIEHFPSETVMSNDNITKVIDAHAVPLENDSNRCEVKVEHAENAETLRSECDRLRERVKQCEEVLERDMDYEAKHAWEIDIHTGIKKKVAENDWLSDRETETLRSECDRLRERVKQCEEVLERDMDYEAKHAWAIDRLKAGIKKKVAENDWLSDRETETLRSECDRLRKRVKQYEEVIERDMDYEEKLALEIDRLKAGIKMKVAENDCLSDRIMELQELALEIDRLKAGIKMKVAENDCLSDRIMELQDKFEREIERLSDDFLWKENQNQNQNQRLFAQNKKLQDTIERLELEIISRKMDHEKLIQENKRLSMDNEETVRRFEGRDGTATSQSWSVNGKGVQPISRSRQQDS
ncbi:hypothetical protein DPMN_124921 [Dreissena polymorpha]|uniref:Uncharacterized protein n=1 Tax=Dreissena polymorpha TaxID=45954 RepID=A0A9D4GUF5_DREPO|nr:hypothetical protein DPMN_124921 [Dreissena polymorpha]